MYTIVVSNLPQDVTEVDLLNHFGSIVGRKDAISCISLAYNNEDEIELCKKRGDIIRKKIILVHVRHTSLSLTIFYNIFFPIGTSS